MIGERTSKLLERRQIAMCDRQVRTKDPDRAAFKRMRAYLQWQSELLRREREITRLYGIPSQWKLIEAMGIYFEIEKRWQTWRRWQTEREHRSK